MNQGEQDERYRQVHAEYGDCLRRLARGYEFDPDRQRDLLQEMHIELWRSLKNFDGRCSMRTWVYRVANNVGADHLTKRRKSLERFVELDALSIEPRCAGAERQSRLTELYALIDRLEPLDRQIVLLYLEGETAAAIAEVTGLSASNISTRIHRAAKYMATLFEGATE